MKTEVTTIGLPLETRKKLGVLARLAGLSISKFMQNVVDAQWRAKGLTGVAPDDVQIVVSRAVEVTTEARNE